MRFGRAFLAVEIVVELARKELKEQFSRFFFGKWLLIIFPFLFILSISFLAKIVLNLSSRDGQLFLFIGFMFWFFFANAVIESVYYVLNQRRLCLSLSRIEITHLPAVKVVTNYLVLIAECAVMSVFLFLKHHTLFFIVHLILISILFLIFTLGVSYLLSIVTLSLKDTLYVLPYLFMFLFWLTPVMFPLDSVAPSYVRLYLLNPLTYFFTAIQKGIFANQPIGRAYVTLPLLAFLFFGVGVSVFYLNRGKLLKMTLE